MPAPPQQQVRAAPPPPDRSDEQTQALAVAQRKKYGVSGGGSVNLATTGMGVAPSSVYSVMTSVLGGGSSA